MMRKTIFMLAACAALPANASQVSIFDNIYLFGDSLSDSGNVAIAAPQFVPDPPYPDGQFTNGDTFATQLGLLPSLAGGTNFAFGGARAADNMDMIPDLIAQVSTFASTVSVAASGNPLAAIWIGGNDFRDFLNAPTDPTILADTITDNIDDGVRILYDAGVRDFAVFGLPNFAALPELAGDDPVQVAQRAAVSDISNLLNASILSTIGSLNSDSSLSGISVSQFDIASLFDQLIATTPEATQSLAFLDALLQDPNADVSDFIFFDDIHPVESVHEIIAAAFTEQFLQPVPLPAGGALILTGLFGFGVLARRRKSLA